MSSFEIELPEGCVVLGYLADMKVLKPDGTVVWAQRSKDITDMEALGMATTMVRQIQRDIDGMTKEVS